MATPTDVMKPALASGISDRAFRILSVLALDLERGWVPLSSVAEQLELTSHQIRLPTSELRAVGLVEHDRRYEKGNTGRPTWRTYVRLTDDDATA